MKHDHAHEVVIKIPQVDEFSYELNRLKKHVRVNLNAYLCLGAGLIIGRSLHKKEPPTIVVRFETTPS